MFVEYDLFPFGYDLEPAAQQSVFEPILKSVVTLTDDLLVVELIGFLCNKIVRETMIDYTPRNF